MEIVLILAGVAALIVVAAVPFLLPWPQHLSWFVASSAFPDPVAMSLGGYLLAMREVAVGDVDPSAERIAVELIETSPRDRPRSWWYVLSDVGATPIATARLERWSAARTPLLLVADADGETSLHGPSHAVVGLRPSPPREDFAVPRLPTPRSSDRDPGWKQHWVPTLVSR